MSGEARPRFGETLIEAYEGRCAITGCNMLDVLEAAHIHPYRGDATNHPSNGLLLRADLHRVSTWAVSPSTRIAGRSGSPRTSAPRNTGR
ncbi:MAG: HNH endonuclease signature motif containing protein [Arhodomonas sp.]|nr:HNH endonuclease signature motif containing protein [Arhodomonas sp.]